jgi:hypothetical protein
MDIWCCGCNREVSARLTSGREVYGHRPDLAALPFWKCDTCGNFVGCHHKTAERTKPLGCIPTPALKDARQHIHRVLDPIWKSGRMKRGEVYQAIAARIGVPEYHTAEIRDIEQARAVYRAVTEIASTPTAQE